MRAMSLWKHLKDPKQAWVCSSPQCDNTFMVCNGWAFPGYQQGDDQIHLYFFCSDACYLQTIPAEMMAKA